jgi:hypothetical protein
MSVDSAGGPAVGWVGADVSVAGGAVGSAPAGDDEGSDGSADSVAAAGLWLAEEVAVGVPFAPESEVPPSTQPEMARTSPAASKTDTVRGIIMGPR